MSEAHVFDKGGVKRVIATVRRVEGEGVELRTDRGNTRLATRQYRKRWYRIATNEGSGEYTLYLQEWDASGHQLQDCTDAEDPDYDVSLTGYDHLGDAGGAVGWKVPGWKVYVADDWRLLIDVGAISSEKLFAVKVTKTAGVAGDSTTLCTYVYTVKNLAGTQLATSKAPKKWRNSDAKRKMLFPAADSIGLAYYDSSDVLQLFDANEVPFVTVC